MRNVGNHDLQASAESTNNPGSGANNESLSVENNNNSTNNININSSSSHNHSRKRAHSGHPKSQSMQPDSNDTAIKRKDVSGITRPDLQRSVPTFLSKLYNMVNDPASNDLIRWSADGTSFIVERHEEFAATVLPRFFKHNTFASFVRQLNMYDFHKIPHIMQGVLVSENEGEVWEFSNSNFQRDQPDLLLLVSRKRTRDRDDKEAGGSELSQLINDIASIKRHQTTISTDLHNLQRDNLILWQDNLAAREKHERHQDMIQKILRFLATVFSNNQIEALSKQKNFILENRHKSESSVDAMYNPPSQPLESHVTVSKNHNRSVNQDAIDVNLPALIQSAKGAASSDKPLGISAAQAPLSTASVVAAALGSTPFGPPTSPVARHPSESSYSSTSQRRGGNSPAGSSKDTEPQTPDNINISQQSSDLAAVAKSAESINEDIDTLQNHIDNLANQLGFDVGSFGDDIDNTDIATFMNQHNSMINGASYNDRMHLFDMIGSPQFKDQMSRHHMQMIQQDAPGPRHDHPTKQEESPLITNAPTGKYDPRRWTPNPLDPRQRKINSLTTLLDELTGLYQAMGGVLKPPADIPESSQYAWSPPAMASVVPAASLPPHSETTGGPQPTSEAYPIPTPVVASPYVPPHHAALSPLSQAQAAGSNTYVPAPGMYDPAAAAAAAATAAAAAAAAVAMPPGSAIPGYPGYPYMGQPMYPGMYYAPVPPGMSQPPAMPSPATLTSAGGSTPTGEESQPSSKRLRTDSPMVSAVTGSTPVAATATAVSGTPPHLAMHMGVPPYHPAYAHLPPHMMYGQLPASGPAYPFYASAFPPGYGYPAHPPHVPPVAGYPGMTTPIPVASPDPTASAAGPGKPNLPGPEAE